MLLIALAIALNHRRGDAFAIANALRSCARILQRIFLVRAMPGCDREREHDRVISDPAALQKSSIGCVFADDAQG